MFNEGDRVRFVGDRPMAATKGAEGNITFHPFNSLRNEYDGNPYIGIIWDRSDPRVNGQVDGGYNVSDFEKVETKMPTITKDNIKAGDKVQLEFTVVESSLDGALCFQVSNYSTASRFYLFDSPYRNFEIVGHTPASPPPWVPKVGDVIQSKGDKSLWSILTVDEDGDWVVRYHQTGHKYLMTKISQVHYELAPSD